MIIFTQSSYLVAAVLFMLGLQGLSSPRTARRAVFLSILGMFLAVLPMLVRVFTEGGTGGMGRTLGIILGGAALGTVLGLISAYKVKMTAMPQMVGIYNGFGGGASLLVAVSEYLRSVGGDMGEMEVGTSIPIHLAVIIGGVTLTGSLIAFGKLQGFISGRPILFPGRHVLNALLGGTALQC